MIPVMLKLKNFLSHSYSEIDFTKFDTALILGSYNGNTDESNGAGKSAVLGGVRWALFDKSRHRKKDSVVKRDAAVATVEFQFKIEEQLYKIVRKRNKQAGESEVYLYRFDSGDFVKMEGDTNTITDKKIVEIINFNHDVFINSVYFKQGDISIFTDSTPSKRKDILKNLLKLDKWDVYQKGAKKRYQKLSTVLATKQALFVPLTTIDEEMAQCSEYIEAAEVKLKGLDREFLQLNNLAVEKKANYQFISDTAGQTKLNDLRAELGEKKKKIANIKRAMTINSKVIEENKASIIGHKKISQNCSVKIDAKNAIDINKKRSQLALGKTKFKVLKENINLLSKDLKSDDECDVCFRAITSKKEAAVIRKNRKVKLAGLKDKYVAFEGKLATTTTTFKRLEKTVEDGTRAELKKTQVNAKISILRAELKKAVSENKSLTQQQDEIINLSDLEAEIEELKTRLGQDNVDKVKQEIDDIDSSLASIKEATDELNINYGSKVAQNQSLIIERIKQEKLEKEIAKLGQELVICSKVRHGFGKDGIQAIIIENIIEELENYTNTILAKICNEPTSINFITQKQTEGGSWTETFDIEVNIGNCKDEFEALSGGEGFRVSMALRLAFSKILSKRMGGSVKFLLLDEVSSALDAKGLNMFANIVERLGKEMKILIITHDDRLKEKFDNILIVEKDSTGSKIIA